MKMIDKQKDDAIDGGLIYIMNTYIIIICQYLTNEDTNDNDGAARDYGYV